MSSEMIYVLKIEQIEAIVKCFTSHTKMAVTIREDTPHEPRIFIEYIEDGKIKTVSV